MPKIMPQGLIQVGLALTLASLVSGQSIRATKSLVCSALDPLRFFYDSTKYECEACP
jgi:hypothetical protein